MTGKTITIEPSERPFVLRFLYRGGGEYVLGPDEVRNLLRGAVILRATRNRVIVRADGGGRAEIVPATLGGGPAFVITRESKRA